jgi:exodeoxyribonuclease-5
MHSLVATEARQLTGYHSHPWLIAVADTQGLPLRGAQDLPLQGAQGESLAEGIPGGSGMISDQAACPMMAYFRHRLKAGFADMPQPFADAAYRGSLMHAAMQFLFAGQEGHSGVPASGRVVVAVEAAMNKHHARQRLLPVSFEAERLRLKNLLLQWLEFETPRQGFTVQCLEQTITAELHGQPISVRADRIDRLDDGGLMIIDYKSSKASTSGWSQDRLQQAQLPLYAVLLSRQDGPLASGKVGSAVRGAVSGVGLATVRQGECEFSGISEEAAGKFDGIKSFDNQQTSFAKRFSDWDHLLQHWQQGVDALAGEIALGLSANILYDKTSLQWAGLDILLRREEGTAWLLEHGGLNDAGDAEEDNVNGDCGDD